MKGVVAFMLFTCLGLVAHAQIANTKWTGNLMVPDPAAVTRSFEADVFEVYIAENNQLLETMSYKISGDTILLRKTSGGSPSPDGSAFTLKYTIQGAQLLLTLLSDECPERAGAWTKEPFTRVKE